jgi:predicted transcriptional regulator
MTRLLTKREVAEILHVSPRSVDNYCSQANVPRLPFVQLPGAKRFKTDDIQEFIAARTLGKDVR